MLFVLIFFEFFCFLCCFFRYFLYPHNVHPNPTWSSWKRACTTSFGSICLGSLILAIIRAIRAAFQMMVDKLHEDGELNLATVCLVAIAKCILSMLDQLVEFVNKFAYAHVAIYGKTFCDVSQIHVRCDC